MFKSICCSSRGVRCNGRHPHGGSLTPVLSSPCEHQVHTGYIDLYSGEIIHAHKIKFKNLTVGKVSIVQANKE